MQILLGKTLTPAAVSTFFVISGYLYFTNISNFNKDTYISKTKRRVKTLLIPYLLWNFAGVLVLIVLKFLNGASISFDFLDDFVSQFWCCNVWNENTINILGHHTPLYAPNDWPLWYLRDLIVMSVLSPVIYMAVKRLRFWYFVILIPLYILNVWTIIPGFGLSAFIFFGMGVYLAIYKGSIHIIENIYLRNTIVLGALLTASISAFLWLKQGVTTFNYSLYNFTTVLLVPTMLIIGEVVSERGVQGKTLLVASSFFVYAFHAFSGINPIVIVGKISRLLHVDGSLVHYLITPFLVYALSVLVYCLINKYLPRITHVITGR